MTMLSFLEIFGHWVSNQGPSASSDRHEKTCRFVGARCNKVNAKEPIGTCSFGIPGSLVTVCPLRFRQDGRLFRDVATLAFGPGRKYSVHPEFRLLTLPNGKRLGKIDYVVACLDDDEKIIDFAAVEVQSVYISGKSMKGAFNEYLRSGKIPFKPISRPDWRSSIQKRLIPQLSLKVPVFRRWGKKFFVAVDREFFGNVPEFKRADSVENSEITWLVYPFDFDSVTEDFSMGVPQVYFSHWDDVQTALREGKEPSQTEVIGELQANLGSALIRF